MEGGLGRRPYVYNPADADYPMAARLAEAPETLPDRKFWGHRAWTGDQNGTQQCVGYGWTHNLASEPINAALDVPWDRFPKILYDAAQLIDEWSDTPPADGTSVRAGARALRAMGKISAWHNAFDVATVRDAILGLGPVVLGINWYDCIPDDQRVLTSDLRWIPIQKVQVGDELVGFDECVGQAARMRRAAVQAMDTVHREVLEITTAQGTVCASGGHLFVRCDRKQGQSWARADVLHPGDRLAYFLEPFDEDTSWEAGWLAGFFDGEGTIAGDYQLNFGQAVGPTLDKAVRLLAGKGFEAWPKQVRTPGRDHRGIVSRKELHNVYVTGLYHGALRFLGQIRPERLLADGARLWEGRATMSRRCSPVEILSVKRLGIEPVHTIATSTRTLIVEGFLSHNSFDDPHQNADGSFTLRLPATAKIRGGHAICAIGEQTQYDYTLILNSWGPWWAKNGVARLPNRILARLLREGGEAVIATEVAR